MTLHNALDTAFAVARQEGRAALIPYLTAGYPDPDRFVDLAAAVLDAGADALEIGIPFSDPLLDGASNQRSQQRALDEGITPAHCVLFARQLGEKTDKPLLFMGAYNPVMAYGLGRFCQDARQAGLSGLIAPDVPFEEQAELRNEASTNQLHLIQMVAPTSTPERMRKVCTAASGFIYCISVAGVTAARASVAGTAKPLVESVKACTRVPVAVGFGISGPEQARQVAAFADGVVVGSALTNTVAEAGDNYIEAARGFISGLHDALEGSLTA